jgi:hypothetical protein
MKGLRARRIRMVKEGTLIATVDIGITSNTGYYTTLDGRSTKSFRFDNTKEGLALGGLDPGVSQQILDGDKVRVSVEQLGSHGMAEMMTGYF